MNLTSLAFSLALLLPTLLVAERGPIICIHGYMRTHRSMDDMVATLTNEGWKAYKWSYSGPRYQIKEHGKHLAQGLKEIAENHPGEPISFVTHSLGGLVLRAAINDPECPSEAKQGRAILLACPNRGSTYGRSMGRIQLVRGLIGRGAGLELITEPHFDHLGTYPDTMEVLVVGGSRDAKVKPEETWLNTAHWRAVGPYYHTWIANQPDVINLTRSFLEGRENGQRE